MFSCFKKAVKLQIPRLQYIAIKFNDKETRDKENKIKPKSEYYKFIKNFS